ARKRNEVLLSFEPPAVRDSLVAAAKRDSITAAQQAAAAGGAGGFGGFGGGGGGGGRGGGGPQPKGPFTPAQVQQAIAEGRKVLATASVNGPVREEVDTI